MTWREIELVNGLKGPFLFTLRKRLEGRRQKMGSFCPCLRSWEEVICGLNGIISFGLASVCFPFVTQMKGTHRSSLSTSVQFFLINVRLGGVGREKGK